MIVLSKTAWRNISIPTELFEEIEKRKPSYMSIAEFIRLSVRSYIDFLGNQNSGQKAEVYPIEGDR